MEDDEDDFIAHGTPLPEIEEESVLRKKAARELEVRDEKGRQRFHGAFTGGFSAGYFNTAGSKEGWTPSTFISSREQKSTDCKQQNPEDFMDDEDFGAFGIATRRIHTTSNFKDQSESRGNKRKYVEVDSVIPGEAPLKDIVKPIRESIGIKILRKLGWKPGQGIGPRIKKSASLKVYGCSFPNAAELEEDDPFAQSYTFAPEDTTAEFYQPKDNVFGLGYSGLSKESILAARTDTFCPTATKSFLRKDKKKLAISGQAFGVGAFEDDDEDIYSKDDMTQYDFSDLELRGASQPSNISGSKQHLSVAHHVLEGFCLATEPPAVKKYFAPPELPPNYRPVRISASPKAVPHPDLQFKPRHNLSSEERSLLLGEKKFQPFQLIVEKKSPDVKQSLENKNRTLSRSTHTFRPFPNDETKQNRYEEYLVLKDLGELHKLVQPSSMTEWEKQQEIEEFSRAAMLFKPLSAALNAKFESRSNLDVEHEVMDALAKARQESTKKAEEKRKLVGMHNRKTSEWYPASLLCRRFNVANPYPNSSEVSGSQKSKSLFSHITFDTRDTLNVYQPSDLSYQTGDVKETVPVPDKKYADNPPENAFPPAKTDEKVQEQSSESGRPPMDFFKDIFENSSSDEEDSASAETENPETPSVIEKTGEEQTSSISTSEAIDSDKKTTESKKVGFGIFANLDLDALNQRTPKVTAVQISENKHDPVNSVTELTCENGTISDKPGTVIENCSSLNDLYGPELPPNYNESSHAILPKFEPRKRAKHKVKHKRKHHKQKNKKKKKKHSSHNSEDSSDSDEDLPPAVILEKIKKLQKVLK